MRALFIDDLSSHFQDHGRCRSVRTLRSRSGVRVNPTHDRFFDQHDFDKIRRLEDQNDIEMFFKEAGLSLATLRKLRAKFVSGEWDDVRWVFLDWDRTVTTWDDLFGDETEAWVRDWKRRGVWPLVRDRLMGSEERCRAVVALLSWLATRKRVQILSNQGDNRAITALLRHLAEDYEEPSLTTIPVVCLEERGNVRKFVYIRKVMGAEACSADGPQSGAIRRREAGLGESTGAGGRRSSRRR